MKQELVEKVAGQIRDTVNRAGDEYPTVAIARYALALAERAAREAAGYAYDAAAQVDPAPRAKSIEAAVERAVEASP